MSAAFIKAQAACLVSRMGHLGPGSRAAAATRNLAMGLDVRIEREQEAYYMAYVRGRAPPRRGLLN